MEQNLLAKFARSDPGVGLHPGGGSHPAARREHRDHSTAAGVRKMLAVSAFGGDFEVRQPRAGMVLE